MFPGYNPVVQVTTENNDYYQGVTKVPVSWTRGSRRHSRDGKVVVFGYSESSSVATQEMINLDALPADQQPNPADLTFVLAEDLNNPNGGIDTRFPFTEPTGDSGEQSLPH